MEINQIRTFIENDFIKRKGRNSGYSLRAHARFLDVDAGALSRFFRGEKVFSGRKLLDLGKKIGVDSTSLKLIFTNSEFEFLDAEVYETCSQWYYLAILECFDLDDFEPSPKWIASKLSIETTRVQMAINQMLRIGILSIDEEGRWQRRIGETSSLPNENVDLIALRNLQKQLLCMAEKSIDEASAETKSHSSLVAAIDPALIPEIKQEIKKFRTKINSLINEKSKNKQEIFCLQINWFECLEDGRKK